MRTTVTVHLKGSVSRAFTDENMSWTAHEDGQLTVQCGRNAVAVFADGTWLYAETKIHEEAND